MEAKSTASTPEPLERTSQPVSEKRELSIGITTRAAEAARKQLDKRGTPGGMIRLGIRGAGCSGFTYVIEFEDKPPRDRDRVFEQDGVKFVVDRKSLLYLAGTELDFETKLMSSGFKFRNPNEKSSCGCGHSFTV
jgi:iron-sulfur cluster assembly protein